MKKINLLSWIIYVGGLILLMPSCQEKEACDGVVCQNGGTCVEGNCDCPPGFSGPFCEVEDLCFGVTCENGGNCIEGACECPPGFSGVNCEIEDLCFNVVCENGGTCIDGTCDCPEGFVGPHCESYDSSKVQAFLDAGLTPFELYNGNVPLDSLYGRTYEGGLIFYLNTEDGTGMVAAMQDHTEEAEWGCRLIDLPWLSNFVLGMGDPSGIPGARIGDGANNTDKILEEGCRSEVGLDNIAAKVCRDLGPEWFLPSISEIKLMHTNLALKGYGWFVERSYWSSTETDSRYSWAHYFSDSGSSSGRILEKSDDLYIRAAKAF